MRSFSRVPKHAVESKPSVPLALEALSEEQRNGEEREQFMLRFNTLLQWKLATLDIARDIETMERSIHSNIALEYEKVREGVSENSRVMKQIVDFQHRLRMQDKMSDKVFQEDVVKFSARFDAFSTHYHALSALFSNTQRIVPLSLIDDTKKTLEALEVTTDLLKKAAERLPDRATDFIASAEEANVLLRSFEEQGNELRELLKVFGQKALEHCYRASKEILLGECSGDESFVQ